MTIANACAERQAWSDDVRRNIVQPIIAADGYLRSVELSAGGRAAPIR